LSTASVSINDILIDPQGVGLSIFIHATIPLTIIVEVSAHAIWRRPRNSGVFFDVAEKLEDRIHQVALTSATFPGNYCAQNFFHETGDSDEKKKEFVAIFSGN